jgi:hypothetical protein
MTSERQRSATRALPAPIIMSWIVAGFLLGATLVVFARRVLSL